MSGIPLIDIAGFETGRPADRAAIAAALAAAVEEIGFLTVTGHGVPEPVIAGLRAAARTFFALPEAEKRRALDPSMRLNRGYTPFAEEHNGSSGDKKAPPDLREGFIFGPFDLPDTPYFADPDAGYAYQPNIWPPGRPALAEAFKAYFRAVEDFNARLMRVFAAALDLPETFFADKFDRHASVVRLLHYPVPAPGARPLPGQLRCGEHTDFGSHTIILADAAPGGLQVRTKAGDWIDVVPPADSFIVNIGDLMMVWTNDRWLSNRHRVANPDAASAEASDRLSVAFFVHPNRDAMIECIPTCRDDGAPARHAPVLAGDYRRMQVEKITAAAQ